MPPRKTNHPYPPQDPSPSKLLAARTLTLGYDLLLQDSHLAGCLHPEIQLCVLDFPSLMTSVVLHLLRTHRQETIAV